MSAPACPASTVLLVNTVVIPDVPWDVVPVELVGTGVTVFLARVWLDVLAADGVDRAWVRHELADVVHAHPQVSGLAATLARTDEVRGMAPASQARWLVQAVRALAEQ